MTDAMHPYFSVISATFWTPIEAAWATAMTKANVAH